MADILFIQAGGTIDKDYKGSNENHGYNFQIGESVIHSVMQRAIIRPGYRCTTACREDSLDMNDDHRNQVRSTAADAKEHKIIITHGTDTIHVTARHLATLASKTIVFTGALKPERFRDSDADFNVGMAVAAVQLLPSGVYIALYGEVLPYDQFIPR